MIPATKLHRLALGKVVAALRKRHGWSQELLADMLGVSQPTVSRLERGTLAVNRSFYCRIANTLGRSEQDLDHDVDEVVKRTRKAAAAAMDMDTRGDDALTTALKVVGMVGLGALLAFTVAAMVDELDRDGG